MKCSGTCWNCAGKTEHRARSRRGPSIGEREKTAKGAGESWSGHMLSMDLVEFEVLRGQRERGFINCVVLDVSIQISAIRWIH